MKLQVLLLLIQETFTKLLDENQLSFFSPILTTTMFEVVMCEQCVNLISNILMFHCELSAAIIEEAKEMQRHVMSRL